MGTPFKMKGSPMARNFNIGTESPVKQVGLVKLAVKYGKKAYKGVKKAIKGSSKSEANTEYFRTEPTYFNVKTGRYQSTPLRNVHKKGDTYSETYPHFKTN